MGAEAQPGSGLRGAICAWTNEFGVHTRTTAACGTGDAHRRESLDGTGRDRRDRGRGCIAGSAATASIGAVLANCGGHFVDESAGGSSFAYHALVAARAQPGYGERHST